MRLASTRTLTDISKIMILCSTALANMFGKTSHTNTIEGYFSIFKRGMKGVYQHCAKKHLHRYAAEFAFRYSNRIAKWH